MEQGRVQGGCSLADPLSWRCRRRGRAGRSIGLFPEGKVDIDARTLVIWNRGSSSSHLPASPQRTYHNQTPCQKRLLK